MAMRCTLLLLLAVPSFAVPTFEVDLDAPPEARWRSVALHYKDVLPRMLTQYMAILDEKLGNETLTDWLQVVDALPKDAHDRVLWRELQGIVDAVNSPEVTMPRLTLWGLMYELQSPTLCSGVLAAMPNGTVVHGRNMDYSFHFEGPDGQVHDWPDVTHEVLWLRGGKPLFTSVNWPGHTGIGTGMRFGGWTFEQNTRMTNSMPANLEAARRGSKRWGIVVRKAMETIPDFAAARDHLYAENYMAPMYFIMAGTGPYEGAVLTIDRGGQHEERTPPIQSITRQVGAWHLVQTNDDLTAEALDYRRPLLNLGLSGVEPGDVDAQFMERTMTNFPAFTASTVFTWVAVPATGYSKTILRGEALAAAQDPLHAARGYGLRQRGAPHRGGLRPGLQGR